MEGLVSCKISAWEVMSQFQIAPTDCPPRTRAAASASPAGRSHSENVWQRDREADPARGGSYSQGKLFDLATTPALRATPPVPGGEPEFQTETLPVLRG